MEQRIRSLPRWLRFCLAGGLATGVNIGLMFVFVEGLQMQTFLFKGIANVMAMGLGAVAAFYLHRSWTWEDAAKHQGQALFRQFALFVGSLSIGVSSRIFLFAALDYYWGIPYLLNVAVGIAGAAIVDYFLYARLVFRR